MHPDKLWLIEKGPSWSKALFREPFKAERITAKSYFHHGRRRDAGAVVAQFETKEQAESCFARLQEVIAAAEPTLARLNAQREEVTAQIRDATQVRAAHLNDVIAARMAR